MARFQRLPLRCLFGCTALATAGASLAVLTPSIAQAQVVQGQVAQAQVAQTQLAQAEIAPGVPKAIAVYAPYPPPPPPPPPPPSPYYREYYGQPREPVSALAIGLDLEGAVPVNTPQLADGNNLTGGEGIKLRVGSQFRVAPGVRFTPEVGYGYDHLYASDNISNSYAWDLNRLFGGVRLAFGNILVPSVYAHVGYGWRTTGEPFVNEGNGIAIDLGGAIDIRLYRRLQFGIHGEWATIDAQPYAPEWVAIGAHIDVAL
jgi:hypothetical protein